MPKEKKLREFDYNQLILEYTIAVRKAWELAHRQITSPEHKKELRFKKELKRRLAYERVKGVTQAKRLKLGDKFLFMEGNNEESSTVYLFQGKSLGGEILACRLATGGAVQFDPDHYVFKLKI